MHPKDMGTCSGDDISLDVLGLVARFYVPCAKKADGKSQLLGQEPLWGERAPMLRKHERHFRGTSPFVQQELPAMVTLGEQEPPLDDIMKDIQIDSWPCGMVYVARAKRDHGKSHI